MKSNEQVHNHPRRDLRSGSQIASALIRYSRHQIPRSSRARAYVRARSAHDVAHTSARADSDRYARARLGAASWRPG